MSTVANDSLFSVLQNFLSPDVLRKISKEINQPVEKTKAGLKSVIPTLLMGIVNKGSTKEGAESLVSIANRQTLPAGISADSETLKEGKEVLSSIFGNNLPSTVSKLGVSTGLNTSSIIKMLGMSAPLVMGVIGTKIKNEKMNASTLMNFLGQQKSSLLALLPSTFTGGLGGVDNQVTRKSVWPKIVLGILLVSGGLWLFNTYEYNANKSVVVMQTPTASFPAANAVAFQSIEALQDFMNSNAADGTLRRFRFENLNFKTGMTTLMSEANTEINQIAFTMKTFPNSTVRIEGFTDNIGPESVNQNISSKRAMAIKNLLVANGVNAGRITTAGMGSSNPIASNETSQGRAENRRIEFVVKK